MERSPEFQRPARLAGAVLLSSLAGCGAVLTATGPSVGKMFSSPDPLERLRAIEGNRLGWRAITVAFLLISAAMTGAFVAVRSAMRGPARALAGAAVVLSAASTLLWLPLLVGRFRVAGQVDDMIRLCQSDDVPDLSGGGGWAFWPYTHTGLLSIASLALALQVSSLRRRTGTLVFVLTVLGEAVAIPRWRDWPPFLSYLLAGIIGTGLVVERDRRRQ